MVNAKKDGNAKDMIDLHPFFTMTFLSMLVIL